MNARTTHNIGDHANNNSELVMMIDFFPSQRYDSLSNPSST